MRRAVALLVLASACGAAVPAARSQTNALSDDVVVLANENVPESVELARYYMEKRSIPANRLCLLDLPVSESLSRKLYELRVRDPVLEFLRREGLVDQTPRDPDEIKKHETAWDTVESAFRYLVLMYGMPLRIEDTRSRLVARIQNHAKSPGDRNLAALDSELSLLLSPAYDIGGPHGNPLYTALWWKGAGREGKLMLIVSRLDGPTPDTVRRMIDDTLATERYGLLGRAYFDSRAVTDPGYQLGDYWIAEACERFLREGYECVLDRSPGLWDESYPMENACVYMGWYTEDVFGPFTREDFRFRPGALAYHIHSASARTIRSETKKWVGPLLARGAAATMGAVSEPFLSLTPHLHMLSDCLCRGYPFGDSAYIALQVVSWQTTLIGDPLYRPFRYSLDAQLRHLEEDGRPEIEWAHVRKINLLVRDGLFNLALNYARAQLEKRDSLVIREKLGDLYARNELLADAGEEYMRVLEGAETAETAVRVGGRWMLILRLHGKESEAQAIEDSIRTKWKDSPVLGWLDRAVP